MEQNDKTSVIIMYAADLGFGAASSCGITKVETPNIDRLAKEGREGRIRVTQADSPSFVDSSCNNDCTGCQHLFLSEVSGLTKSLYLLENVY